MMSRDTAILPRKLDWMLKDRMDDLKTVMNDNATFINFPPIGSSTSLITVYGDNKVNIQRTIRSIMQLVNEINKLSIYLYLLLMRNSSGLSILCGLTLASPHTI